MHTLLVLLFIYYYLFGNTDGLQLCAIVILRSSAELSEIQPAVLCVLCSLLVEETE